MAFKVPLGAGGDRCPISRDLPPTPPGFEYMVITPIGGRSSELLGEGVVIVAAFLRPLGVAGMAGWELCALLCAARLDHQHDAAEGEDQCCIRTGLGSR